MCYIDCYIRGRNSKLNIMEEQKIVVEQVVVTQPEGKGAAVAGFILALLGILVPFNVIAVLAGSAAVSYVGLVICIASVVLCAMAMGKLKRTGGKRGLAIAGLVIGLVATVWSALAVVSIGKAIEARNRAAGDLQTEMMKMQNEMNNH